MTRKTLIEYFTYLDKLRESGRCNMFGSSRYLEDEMGAERAEAVTAVGLWMKTFDKESTAAARAAKAMKIEKESA